VDDEKLKPNYVQQKMLALSGQNIDDFMKEMESVQKKKELERLAEEEKAKTSSGFL
jgi:WW domain-binding protein 11